MLWTPLILQQCYKMRIITFSAIERRAPKLEVLCPSTFPLLWLSAGRRQTRDSNPGSLDCDCSQKSKVMLWNEHSGRPGRIAWTHLPQNSIQMLLCLEFIRALFLCDTFCSFQTSSTTINSLLTLCELDLKKKKKEAAGIEASQWCVEQRDKNEETKVRFCLELFLPKVSHKQIRRGWQNSAPKCKFPF